MAVLVHRALVTATLGVCLFAASPALAQSESRPFRRATSRATPNKTRSLRRSATPAPLPGLIAVPRKRAPITLEIAPLEIADVAEVEPFPRARRSRARPRRRIVLVEGDND